jgi:hypothetical protein
MPVIHKAGREIYLAGRALVHVTLCFMYVTPSVATTHFVHWFMGLYTGSFSVCMDIQVDRGC